MPKMKSNSGAKKRIKVTSNGKLRRNRAFHSHLLTHKSKKRKRRLRASTLLKTVDKKRMKKLLGI